MQVPAVKTGNYTRTHRSEGIPSREGVFPLSRLWYKCNLIMKKRMRYTPLELRVLTTMEKHSMLQPGEHVLVASSGGADSMAMLTCLHRLAPRLNLRLTVGHLNHGIRGEEGDEDEAFVRTASSGLGLPFLSERADLRAYAAASGENLEEAARQARYRFLEQAAAGVDAGKIATGHTLNDQAETILLRLLRGSGPEGFAGIRPVLDNRIIRPMIECSRAEIVEYLSGRGILFREDSSNRDLRYQRNRVRHELIPYLERHFNPRLLQVLEREAGITSETHAFLENLARSEYRRLSHPVPDRASLPAPALRSMHVALRREVVREALRQTLGSLRGIGTVHIDGILKLCEPGKSGRWTELPGGFRARRELDNLVLGFDVRPERVEYSYELAWPGICTIPEAGVEFSATLLESPPSEAMRPGDECVRALLDPAALPPLLILRPRRPGDRYGGRGHRRVKKMLLAARLSISERDMNPLVTAGDAVIWIPGFPPAKFFVGKPGSGRCVLLEARRLPESG